jgi:hypothetical protein
MLEAKVVSIDSEPRRSRLTRINAIDHTPSVLSVLSENHMQDCRDNVLVVLNILPIGKMQEQKNIG